jgi:hypothetical protein
MRNTPALLAMTAVYPFQSECQVAAGGPLRRQPPMKCRIYLKFMILQWGENLNIKFDDVVKRGLPRIAPTNR